MPKNKTHSGAKKRFRVTGSGKVIRQQAGHVHKFHENPGGESGGGRQQVRIGPARRHREKRQHQQREGKEGESRHAGDGGQRPRCAKGRRTGTQQAARRAGSRALQQGQRGERQCQRARQQQRHGEAHGVHRRIDMVQRPPDDGGERGRLRRPQHQRHVDDRGAIDEDDDQGPAQLLQQRRQHHAQESGARRDGRGWRPPGIRPAA